MDPGLLVSNLTNPTLLFRTLGILAVGVKSNLETPATTTKFTSLYLLFSIGFKGGVESFFLFAVPAALRLAVPKADPGLYIPMALGVTFPMNITIGMPLYEWVVFAT